MVPPSLFLPSPKRFHANRPPMRSTPPFFFFPFPLFLPRAGGVNDPPFPLPSFLSPSVKEMEPLFPLPCLSKGRKVEGFFFFFFSGPLRSFFPPFCLWKEKTLFFLHFFPGRRETSPFPLPQEFFFLPRRIETLFSFS